MRLLLFLLYLFPIGDRETENRPLSLPFSLKSAFIKAGYKPYKISDVICSGSFVA